MTYLRPDSKSQVTIEYSDEGVPQRIDTIVVSTQHDDFVKPTDDTPEAQRKADEQMLATIRKDVINILMPRVKKQLSDKVLALFDGSEKYLSTQQASLSSEAPTATPASRAARSSSTPTAGAEPTVVAPSRARTPQR